MGWAPGGSGSHQLALSIARRISSAHRIAAGFVLKAPRLKNSSPRSRNCALPAITLAVKAQIARHRRLVGHADELEQALNRRRLALGAGVHGLKPQGLVGHGASLNSSGRAFH